MIEFNLRTAANLGWWYKDVPPLSCELVISYFHRADWTTPSLRIVILPSSSRSGSAVTIAMVARHAGVSPMSVSNVLNGRKVRPEISTAVMHSIEELDYVPNAAARQLANGSSIAVGLLHGAGDSPFANAILAGVLTAAAAENVQIILKTVDLLDAASGWEAVHALRREGAKAALLPPVLSDLMDKSPTVKRGSVALMAISPGKELDTISTVRIDETAAAYEMTSLLIGNGHSRIGFIRALDWLSMAEARLTGYLAALRDHGLLLAEELIVEGQNSFQASLHASGILLDLTDPPTAIFASNDEMAAGALVAAHIRKIDVPDRLSIAGFDDSLLSRQVWPALTSVRIPVADMTKLAIFELKAQVRVGFAVPVSPVHHQVDYKIVQRASSGV